MHLKGTAEQEDLQLVLSPAELAVIAQGNGRIPLDSEPGTDKLTYAEAANLFDLGESLGYFHRESDPTFAALYRQNRMSQPQVDLPPRSGRLAVAAMYRWSQRQVAYEEGHGISANAIEATRKVSDDLGEIASDRRVGHVSSIHITDLNRTNMPHRLVRRVVRGAFVDYS